MKTREFLLSTHAKLQGLRVARSTYASQFAPNFNAIGLIAPSELVLSNILRELLDPHGSHAQGRKFLDIFIQQFVLTSVVKNREVRRVATEVLTDANQQSERRIDILIEFSGDVAGKKVAIAIENKPWASDGLDQIKHYLKHLGIRYPDGYVLIYLSGDEGRHPSNHSIDAGCLAIAIDEKHLLVSCYADLLPWLTACRTQCEAPSVQVFLQSFEQYIRQQFMGIQDMTERQQLVAEATRSLDNIETSFDLISAQNDIKRSLISQLEKQLKQGIEDGGHSWNFLGSMDITKAYGTISIQLKPGDQYTVSFGFDKPGGGAFCYGIYKDTETDADLPEIRAELDQIFNAKGNKTVWWPWYLDFEQPVRDWRNSSKPWVQIASGEMAKWMIETAIQIELGLQQKGLESHLKGNGVTEK